MATIHEKGGGGDVRGRYREGPETAKSIPPGEALTYRFTLPTAHHVVLPGHRIRVGVQSSWFPLYDRNPHTFVLKIFWARPRDYAKVLGSPVGLEFEP